MGEFYTIEMELPEVRNPFGWRSFPSKKQSLEMRINSYCKVMDRICVCAGGLPHAKIESQLRGRIISQAFQEGIYWKVNFPLQKQNPKMGGKNTSV